MRKENIVNIVQYLQNDRIPYIQSLIDEFSTDNSRGNKIRLQLEIKNFISNAYSVFDYFSKDLYDKLSIKTDENKKNFKVIFNKEKYDNIREKVWLWEINIEEWFKKEEELDQELITKSKEEIKKFFGKDDPIIEFLVMIQPYSWNKVLHDLFTLNNYLKHFDLCDIKSNFIEITTNREYTTREYDVWLYAESKFITIRSRGYMEQIVEICDKIINFAYYWIWKNE